MTKSRMIPARLALVLGGVLLVPTLALAVEANVGVNTTAQVTTPAAVQVKVDAKMQAAKDKATKEIDRRIKALNDLNIRVEAMQRVTESFKQTLSTNVQNQVSGLNQLKAKIDADTELEVLKTDIKTITDSYRVYMLVMPQARIAAAADREVTLITMMNQLGAKLQARISASQSAGADVSKLLAALTDMSAKLSNASTQAQAAVSVSAGLAPDEGEKTKMAANAAALKSARTSIQAAHTDLVAARKDADQIIKGLKALPAPTMNESSTTSAPAAQ